MGPRPPNGIGAGTFARSPPCSPPSITGVYTVAVPLYGRFTTTIPPPPHPLPHSTSTYGSLPPRNAHLGTLFLYRRTVDLSTCNIAVWNVELNGIHTIYYMLIFATTSTKILRTSKKVQGRTGGLVFKNGDVSIAYISHVGVPGVTGADIMTLSH